MPGYSLFATERFMGEHSKNRLDTKRPHVFAVQQSIFHSLLWMRDLQQGSATGADDGDDGDDDDVRNIDQSSWVLSQPIKEGDWRDHRSALCVCAC